MTNPRRDPDERLIVPRPSGERPDEYEKVRDDDTPLLTRANFDRALEVGFAPTERLYDHRVGFYQFCIVMMVGLTAFVGYLIWSDEFAWAREFLFAILIVMWIFVAICWRYRWR